MIGASSSLWTPEGEVSTLEKDVVHITKADLAILARFHEFAQKYQFSVVCPRCDTALMGANNDSTITPSVACKCRELRYIGG